MNKKISFLLPTRGRPDLLKRLFQSIVDTTHDLKSVEIILCLDDDDLQSQHIDDPRLNIVKLIGTKSTMGDYNTKCLNRSTGDIIILLNDDLTLETPGWDRIISDFALTIPDGIFMAYPNDTESRQHMCTFPIMSRKTCEILSNPYPQEYEALHIDQHIFDIFIRLKHLGKNRMFYFDNVIFKHNHFINGDVRPDASYSHKKRLPDAMVFISLRHLRQVSAQRLLSSIEGRSLPAVSHCVVIEKPPANLLQAIFKYFTVFFRDYGLPLSRRFILFAGFLKYYAAMVSGLNFLKRKSYTLYGSR
jgi:glycosyltransferase involved in cell wall biosynthesis